ncbi:MAG: HlyD family type I secretion periplasmic adaptor subunit [Betaproteobacteria bacterium]|nr:MAG: HlyD family type I secretion periplasmic adaptor subunit [Betaproteobacteria bacterium]
MLNADPADFSPPLLRIQQKPPPPLAGWMLRLLIALLAGLALWAVFGQLDIVAVADGKLVPSSYLKIVQPAEQGIVKEILVKEGDRVEAGKVLIRMDAALTEADVKAIQSEYDNKRLALRRIDAQLSGKPLSRERGDPAELYAQLSAQHAANVRAYENALAQEKALLDKARHDLTAAQATKAKLEQVLPHYVEQEKAFEKLTKDGFAGRIMYTDKQRERIEKEQDLRTQEATIRGAQSLIDQSEQKIGQITADYRRQLQTERNDVAAQFERTAQELAKLSHRHELLELRAPQAGIVKDLATHTAGTVAAPGTILMTLVPEGDKLVAEVWVSNQDVGFVRPGQEAKLKLTAFQFQKYGLVQGKVLHVNADATEAPSPNTRSDALTGRDRPMGPLAFRALVELASQDLLADGQRYVLQPGMQVAGEIHLGTRTILEYLLSPVQKAFHEAARER